MVIKRRLFCFVLNNITFIRSFIPNSRCNYYSLMPAVASRRSSYSVYGVRSTLRQRHPRCDQRDSPDATTSHVAHVQAPLLHCCSLVVVMGQNVFRYIEIIYYPETYIKIISIITVIFNTCLFLCVSKWVCSSDAYSTDVRMNFTDYRQFVPGVIRRPVHGRTPAVVPCTRNRQNDKVVWCRRQFTAGL